MRSKLFSSRKADFNIMTYLMTNVYRIIFIFMCIIITVMIITMASKMEVNTSEIEMESLASRIFFSPTAISHVDPVTARAYPGIIDPERLNDQHLDASINFHDDSQAMAANITLYSVDSSGNAVLGNPVASGCVNRKGWILMWPKRGTTGKGGASWVEKIIPVNYADKDGRIMAGALMIRVVTIRGG